MTLDDIAGRVSARSHAPDCTATVPPTGRRRRQPPRPAALVAGGAGFLGSHLCDRLLAEGMRVYCLDSFQTGRPENVAHLLGEPGFVMVEHDVRAPAPVFPDLVEVYNLACPASPPHYQKAPVSTAMTSVQGTLELLTLAARVGERFTLTSTSEIYGDPEVHPQPEAYCGRVNPIGPRACYDEGKRLAETLCFDFMRQHGVDVRVARIFNTYGPRMRLDDGRVVSNLIGQALRGAAMTIYGDGSQTRSFCYAGDTVDGLMRLMRTRSSGERPSTCTSTSLKRRARRCRARLPGHPRSGRGARVDTADVPRNDQLSTHRLTTWRGSRSLDALGAAVAGRVARAPSMRVFDGPAATRPIGRGGTRRTRRAFRGRWQTGRAS